MRTGPAVCKVYQDPRSTVGVSFLARPTRRVPDPDTDTDGQTQTDRYRHRHEHTSTVEERAQLTMEKDYVNPYLQPGFVRDKGKRMPRAAAVSPPSQRSSLAHAHFWEAKMRVRVCVRMRVRVCVCAH